MDMVYMASELDYIQFSMKIDHSALNPAYSHKEVLEEAKLSSWYKTNTIIVKPSQIAAANSVPGARVISTIGFPHGGTSTRIKATEGTYLHSFKCPEADMVMNIGAFKSKNFKSVEAEIRSVKNAFNNITNNDFLPSGTGNVLKVIIEVGYLTDEEIADACKLVEQSGGDMVKTSTGYGPRGATLKDIEIMKNSVSSDVGVKAAGGIRTLESALAMLDAGANRLGLTATKQICDDWRKANGLDDLKWDDPENIELGHELGKSFLHQLLP